MISETGPVIALDLGGTWIKGACRPASLPQQGFRVERIANPGPDGRCPAEFAEVLREFCLRLTGGIPPASVCIATAGEVASDGTSYLATAAHLGMMGSNEWQAPLRELLACPFWMLNDAEAFLTGAAEEKRISPAGHVAALLVGTGLGFCICREGRWWKPSRRLPLFGALCTPVGTFDEIASAVLRQKTTGRTLVQLLTGEDSSRQRAEYLDALAGIAAGVCSLCHPDKIVFGGGLADAAAGVGYPLAAAVAGRLPALLARGVAAADVSCVPEANKLILLGALAIAGENLHAEGVRFRDGYGQLPTESPGSAAGIESAPPVEIIRRLWIEEQQAGQAIEGSLGAIADVAAEIALACKKGKRVIYVGAGTSGRIAAMDSVEMACTYGVPRSQFTAIIAGGGADAAWDIESNHEEDRTSVPELLLMQPGPGDLVIGVSVSGTAFFVRSALCCARRRGALTVLIHEAPAEPQFFDYSIRLHSGSEVVSGSTRMKGGTSTKKVLNWLGTCAMILLGKTRDGWMIDFNPCNQKLLARAVQILSAVRGVPPREAKTLLAAHGNCLRSAISPPVSPDSASATADAGAAAVSKGLDPGGER